MGLHPRFLGAGGRSGVVWEWGMAGNGGRGSLRASSRPLPTFLGVWGWTGGCCLLQPSPDPAKGGKSRTGNPAHWGEEMNPPPSWGTDPGPSSPLWDPQTRLRTPQSKENPPGHCGEHWGQRDSHPPQRHRGPCCGCHPRPGLTKSPGHAFQRHFPKQTSHLFTGRQSS